MLSTLTMQPDRGRNRRTGTPNDRSLAAAGAANGSVVRPTTLASARGRSLARRVAVRPAPPCCLLCHLAVSTGHCDFSAAHSALRRHVDRDILAGVSWAVLVGRDFWSTCNVSAGRTRRRTSRCALTTSSGVLEYQVGHFLCCLAAARGRQLLTRRPDRGVHTATGDRRVLRRNASSLDDTELAQSSITIRQLMSHSSGLSYGMFDPGTTIFKAYDARKIVHPGSTLRRCQCRCKHRKRFDSRALPTAERSIISEAGSRSRRARLPCGVPAAGRAPGSSGRARR